MIGLNTHIDNMMDNLEDFQRLAPDHLNAELDDAIGELLKALEALIGMAGSGLYREALEGFLQDFETRYTHCFNLLRAAAQSGQISMRSLESTTRYVATLRRIVRQYAKALRSLAHLPQSAAPEI